MSQQEELLQLLSEAKSSRRNLLRKAAAGSLTLAAGGLLAGATSSSAQSAAGGVTPVDVLNFALNLEYLEAEYYTIATTGTPLYGNVSGDVFPTNGKVPFVNYGAYANQIAKDEQNHVAFLVQNLGSSAVPRPAIDLVNSFNAAASAATIGPTFNPFESELNFILGAFIFEDVGVTAYHGGAGYLESTPTYLSAAAGILGIEAYHAGLIRKIIAGIGGAAVATANKISHLRALADSAAGGSGHETPLPAIAATDAKSITFSRTPQEVLNIVYLNASSTPASKGGFFPNGLNGTLTTS
jgi:hypothetical protein